MDPKPLTLILSLFFFFITISSDPCKPDSCNSILGPQVEFPFRLKRQPARCGYPGFDLYCNSQNQTILNLPYSGKFIVDHINYKSKSLFINFTFSRRPPQFPAAYTTTFMFLNCSSDYKHYHSTPNMSLFCLSRRNYTVLAMSPRSSPVPPTCRRIESVLVPLQWTLSEFYWSAMDLQNDLEQVWSCLSCENEGGLCGYKGDSGPEVSCIGPRPSKGHPKSAKYGIGIGIGISGLVCIIGLALYACGKVSGFNSRPITVLEQRPTIRSTSGLDRPTIESYPTTVLGQSRRLPDATCPICLSNYQPNERLRSIPECNHYFHADCIDEWLKLSASCPLCRNSRESSIPTPCFSSSTASPSTI